MNFWLISSLIFISICHFSSSTSLERHTFPAAKQFLWYRTNSIIQKSCTCRMPFSCSCCEHVRILFQKEGKRLCVNFTYQRNGLNVDISLNSDILQNMTITNYKRFRTCVPIPRCLFSIACVNILELNQFPRSITACLRLDVTAKKELWKINYNCISISTELPTMPSTSVDSTMETPSTAATSAMPPEMSEMPAMPPEMSETPAMPPAMSEMPAMPPGMTGMPAMPPVMAGMPAMPPAMAGMPAMPPEMTGMPAMPPEMTGMPAMPPAMAGMPAMPPEMAGMPAMPPAMPPAMSGMPAMPPAISGMPAMSGTGPEMSSEMLAMSSRQ